MKNLQVWIVAIVSALTISTSMEALAQNTFGNERSQCQATLTATNRNSRITLRSGPGTNYRSVGYGLVGDRVYVLTVIPPEVDYQKDRQGYGWYRVGFPRSGAKGWIREDFLRVQCAQIND